MTIVHIVLFEFEESATPEQITNISQSFLSLTHRCRHPKTGQQYVVSSSGGRNNSPEGLSAGITHAFISHFVAEEDRKYYLEEDPAHRAFVQSIEGVVKRAQVVDFTPGKF